MYIKPLSSKAKSQGSCKEQNQSIAGRAESTNIFEFFREYYNLIIPSTLDRLHIVTKPSGPIFKLLGKCNHIQVLFHCTQCPCEFCSGCFEKFFKNENECGKGYCKKSAPGLHAHHPRDCLFYLRDFSVQQLQGLLRNNNVEFYINPRAAQIAAAKEMKEQEVPDEQQQENQEQPVEVVPVIEGEEQPTPQPHIIDGEQIELVCQVMLQKETPDGLVDEECFKEAPPGMAGLCITHYKEYLVSEINKSQLDPVELCEIPQIKVILKREEVKIPQRKDEETDEKYKHKLIEIVKEKIPLGKIETSFYG